MLQRNEMMLLLHARRSVLADAVASKLPIQFAALAIVLLLAVDLIMTPFLVSTVASFKPAVVQTTLSIVCDSLAVPCRTSGDRPTHCRYQRN